MTKPITDKQVERDLSLPENAEEVLKRFLIYCACPGHAVDGAIEIIRRTVILTKLQATNKALDEVESIGKRYKNAKYSTDQFVIPGKKWDKLLK